MKVNNGDEGKTQDFVAALLKNTPVFENGGRAATTTFSQRNIGDVLVTFENEANYVSKKLTQDQFEIVYPSYTIISEAPVAVVDSVVDKRHARRCRSLPEKPLERTGSRIGRQSLSASAQCRSVGQTQSRFPRY